MNRRSGILLGRRFALMLVLVVATLVASTGSAAADDTSPLVVATVYGPGGVKPVDSVSLSALTSGSRPCPVYPETSMTEYGRAGPVTVQLSPTDTWSLATILACLQTPIPAADVTGVTIINDQGAPELGPGSQLTRSDLSSPSDFQITGENPVITDNGSTVEYDRPWRGESDDDQGDGFQEAPPLSLEVFEGPILTVTARASKTTVSPGTTVSFTATATGPDASGLAYSWDFAGAAPDSTQPSPEVMFANAGTYDVAVQVSDSAGGGGSALVPITVGPPSGPRPTGHPRAGPTASQGETPRGKPGHRQPDSSVGSPHPRATGDSPGSGAGGKTGSGTGSGAGTPSTPGNSSTTKPSSQSQTGSSAHSGSSASSGSPSDHRSRSKSHSARGSGQHPGGSATGSERGRPRLATTTASQAPVVSGRLISDVLALPAGASPLVHGGAPSAVTAPPARRAPSPSILPVLAAVLGVLALLGLGAGRELRGGPGWRMPRFGG